VALRGSTRQPALGVAEHYSAQHWLEFWFPLVLNWPGQQAWHFACRLQNLCLLSALIVTCTQSCLSLGTRWLFFNFIHHLVPSTSSHFRSWDLNHTTLAMPGTWPIELSSCWSLSVNQVDVASRAGVYGSLHDFVHVSIPAMRVWPPCFFLVAALLPPGTENHSLLCCPQKYNGMPQSAQAHEYSKHTDSSQGQSNML